MQYQENDIITILKLVFEPGDTFEIRCLDATVSNYRKEHTESGYFTYENIGKVFQELSRVSARGVYFTPNPVSPELLARSANRIQAAKRDMATNDADILSRRWLLVDCDPVRRSGISANEAEHDAALYMAMEIGEKLSSQGWPEPVMLDSGNGAQLMYRIDLPADDDGLIQACLNQLAKEGDDKVKIDTTVHNPSRIWRLSGTPNRKGDEVGDRVYRMAKIVSVPDELQLVSKEMLQELAGNYQEEDAISNDTSQDGFNLDSWIAQYCPDAEGPMPWKGGRKWIFPVCPFNQDHDNRSAVITQQSNGAIGFTCHHNGCTNNDWHALRELKGDVKPQEYPEVDLSGILKNNDDSSFAVEIKPWRLITNQDVEQAISGTILGELTEIYRQTTTPPLPLEAGIMKAIVSIGCALSGKAESLDMSQPLYKYVQSGAPLARLCIDTAGGQVANFFAILVGNSSSGKDIGGLLGHVAAMKNWKLPSRASAEGLADCLMEINNGLIATSEFQDWLNPTHWLNKSISFITEIFDAGSFEYGLSQRGKKTGKRVSNYCYPNFMANIQPDVFENSLKRSDITSGFLARFLICNMPLFFGDPAAFDLCESLRRIDRCLDAFLVKKGTVNVPSGYLSNLSEMFRKHSSEKLHPTWRRLVLGYGPRFAVMLSITHENAHQTEIVLDDRCWQGAETLILWFFAHAEKALSEVEEDNPIRKERERIYRKLFAIIRKKDTGDGVLLQTISRHGIWGTTAKERGEGLIELRERGILKHENGRYFIANTPVGWE